ncbi:MAG TPA: BlaI/MecI/CopY family transcriptional regulator [Steroidobacteraceae bacterium]|nr:BlaI/MecI/CopY family transcriptional regulator [Steroidobacteraceae bacterium]
MATQKDLPPLTRAEAEIMQMLWRRNEATVHELVEATDRSVAYTTMLTLVRILEKKGYVRHQLKAGQRAYVYSPAVAQGAARRHHVRDFVARFFGGRTEDLLVGLIADEELPPETLAELRKRIDARLTAERKKRGKG